MLYYPTKIGKLRIGDRFVLKGSSQVRIVEKLEPSFTYMVEESGMSFVWFDGRDKPVELIVEE